MNWYKTAQTSEDNWINVNNSNCIKAIGFDEDLEILSIEFRHGMKGHYADVTPDVYKAFLESDSQGTFFNSNIKDQFPTV